MSSGLPNATAMYQRLQEECLGDLQLQTCFIYLDDLIIFSSTFREHTHKLEHVFFQRNRQFGLKLSPEKCSFITRKLKYIRHIVSNDGVELDPDKIN